MHQDQCYDILLCQDTRVPGNYPFPHGTILFFFSLYFLGMGHSRSDTSLEWDCVMKINIIIVVSADHIRGATLLIRPYTCIRQALLMQPIDKVFDASG
jgi:hypothetical protein